MTNNFKPVAVLKLLYYYNKRGNDIDCLQQTKSFNTEQE